jgi:hypothetical protein
MVDDRKRHEDGRTSSAGAPEWHSMDRRALHLQRICKEYLDHCEQLMLVGCFDFDISRLPCESDFDSMRAPSKSKET